MQDSTIIVVAFLMVAIFFPLGYMMGDATLNTVHIKQISYCMSECESKGGLINVHINGPCMCHDGDKIIPSKSTK